MLVKNEGEVVFFQSMILLRIRLMAIILIFLRNEHLRKSIWILKWKEQKTFQKNLAVFGPFLKKK